MSHDIPLNRKNFGLLLIWRSLIVLAALYSVLEKPIDQIVLALVGLWLLLMVGEVSYRFTVQGERRREQQRRDKEWREQRAEEARQRFLAAQAQAQAQAGSTNGVPRMMSLDYDEMPEQPLKPAPEGIQRLSADEFELALLQADKRPLR